MGADCMRGRDPRALSALARLAPLVSEGFGARASGACILLTRKGSSAFIAIESVESAADPVAYAREFFEGVRHGH
jgi:hypothetical protein